MGGIGARLRILLFGDTHLGFDYPVRPRVQRRRRGPDFFDNYRRVLDYAARIRPDFVVHGGDFFHRSRVPPAIVEMAYEPLSALADSGVPIFVVPGNHERGVLPSSLWLGNRGIHVFDRPRTFRIFVEGTSVAISGFPFQYGDIRSRLGDVLAATEWADVQADVRFFCMHHAVEGAQVGPSNFTFRSTKDVIKLRDVPSTFAAVLAGHIHRRQVLPRVLEGVGPPVIYPGSTERTSFAEKDEPKGFFEVTLAIDEGDCWSVDTAEFHLLPVRPMVDLDVEAGVDVLGLRRYLERRIAALDADSVVRLRCAPGLDRSVLVRLTAPFLRSVFPVSMNVQHNAAFGRRFRDGFRGRREGVG